MVVQSPHRHIRRAVDPGPHRHIRRLVTAAVVVLAAALAPAPAAASFIVYGCGENLCRIAPDGTGARQITTDGSPTATYHWPSLSRDGRRMSWLRGNDLMLGDASAHATAGPLVRTGWFNKIRPDGAQVGTLVLSAVFYGLYAYVYDGSGTIAMSGPEPTLPSLGWAADNQHVLLPMENPDGSGVGICVMAPNPVAGWDCARRVAFTPGAYLTDPAVSPNGRTVAVTVLPDGSASAGHLALYDYGTGAFIRTLTAGTADALPAWSPDGAMIAFQRGKSVDTIQADRPAGSERLLVTAGETPTWGGAPDPAATRLTLAASQRGTAVRARLIVRLAGSRLDAELIGRGAGVAGRRLGSIRVSNANAGPRSLTIPLNGAGRSALKRRSSLALTLRITVRPPTGPATTLTSRLTARR